MFRVLLADDHTYVHQIERSLLEAQFEVVGSVYDGQALIEAAVRLHPDLIITDISMPILNGIDAVNQLKNAGSTAVVIFVTVHTDPELTNACFAAGAAAHVPKTHMATDLLPAIYAALQSARG